jgi:hypothetical protein
MSEVSDISGLISAGVAVASVLGSGMVFLWGRVEFNNRKIHRELTKCHEREHLGRERRGTLMIVIELLWQEVTHLLPEQQESWTLTRAKKLLDDIKRQDEVAQAVQDAEKQSHEHH